MARKKRKPGKQKPSRGRPSKGMPEIPDWRAVEGHMHQLVGTLSGAGHQNTPQAKAQRVMYQAFEERDALRQVSLAKKALEICPDCADAYVLLAEHSPNLKESLALWEKGVQAGKQALGPSSFQEAVGHFWGILETRPYMRARLGFACALWGAGRRAEAVAHLQEMLRLNPNDNQGVRYTLAGFLLSMDRDQDLAELIQQYPEEGSAAWVFTAALLAFRKKGATPEACQLLDKAKKANQHVPDIVLGKKDLPQAQPPYYSPGQESEAVVYAQIFLPGWKNTPGALTWLRQSEESTHEHLLGPRRPGLLEMPGVTPAQVGSCFEAAAGFYRQAPWKIVGDDSTLKVECARYQSGPWYAVIMGQAGRTLGLALYEDLRIVRLMQQGRMTDEEHSRQVAVLVLTFGEQTELTVKDLEASQQHRWQVAGPEAYPDIFKKERGASLRPPLAWELELMEGCLRAIPEFVKRRKPADSTIEELILTVVGGELKLVLTWEG